MTPRRTAATVLTQSAAAVALCLGAGVLAACGDGDTAAEPAAATVTDIPTVEINADCSTVRGAASAVLLTSNQYAVEHSQNPGGASADMALADLAVAGEQVGAVLPGLQGPARDSAEDLLEDIRELEQAITAGQPAREVFDELSGVSEELAEFLQACTS